MNGQSSSSTSTAPKQSQSLSELEQQLREEQKKVAELQAQQAESKLKQESLKKVIDAISKNLEEYKRDGDALGKDFQSYTKQVEHKLHCLREALGDAFEAVRDAIRGVGSAITDKEQKSSELEKTIAGELDLGFRGAGRTTLMDQQAFEQITVKSMKDRLTQVQGLLKEANAIAGSSLADYAAAYALVWLAMKYLSKTFLVADVVSKVVEFKFPANAKEYESQLIAAYDVSNASSVEEAKAQKRLENARAELDLAIKTLGTLRVQRKDDTVAAAKKAVPKSTPAYGAKDESARRS